MTVLLVLFTLIIFLTIDYFLHRTAKATVTNAVPESVTSPLFALPENIALTRNHTWLKKEADGTITLGLDRFLTKAVGNLKEIILPAEGSIITHATSDITLAEDGKRLALESPVVGRVVAVNRDLAANPASVNSDPYANGWLVKVSPIPELDRSRDFLVQRPTEWLRDQFERAAEFFGARNAELGIVTMRDGGELVDGLLTNTKPEVWAEFKSTFAALPRIGQ